MSEHAADATQKDDYVDAVNSSLSTVDGGGFDF